MRVACSAGTGEGSCMARWHRLPADALWWGDVMTDNAGKDARGPDLVWRVPSLGAPSPSQAWDCGRGGDDGDFGQGCPPTRPRVARAFPGSTGALAGLGLW